MRCPKCSYISFDDQVACVKCNLQLDGKNALPFQGTAIRAESILYLRTLPAAEELPSFDPVAEEPLEDPTDDLYRQLAAEGMGAGLAGQAAEAELDLSFSDAVPDNESLLLDDLPPPAAAESVNEPAFDLEAAAEIPSLELGPEAEVNSFRLDAEEKPAPFELEPEEEAHSLELQVEPDLAPFDLEAEDETSSLELQAEPDLAPFDLEAEEEASSLELQAEPDLPPFDLGQEEEAHSLELQVEPDLSPFDLEAEDETSSLELQTEEEALSDDFSDFRPEIDDGEPGSGSDNVQADAPGHPIQLSAPETAEPAFTFPESVPEQEELDLMDLETSEEEPGPAGPNSFAPRNVLGDGIFDLSDLMGGESTDPSADGPTIADNADMLLDLTFAGEAEGAADEPGYDSRLTEEDELDLNLDLEDEKSES